MSTERTVRLLAVATHLLPARGWGGVAVTARTFFELLAANNRSELSIIASDACRETGHIRQKEISFTPRISIYPADSNDKSAFSWAAIPLLARSIYRSDFVYSAGIMTWPTTLAAIGATLFQRPFAFHAHGGLLEDRLAELRAKRLKWLLFKYIILPFLRRACFLNCSSQFEAENATKILRKPIIITPNYQPISSIPYVPYVDSVHTSGGRNLRLTFVGRLHRDKGIRRFCKIWQSFAGDGDVLQIIGGHDDRYGRELIAEHSDDQRFRFLGERSRTEVFRLIAQSDALILPSGLEGTLRENFGNVVPEALAVGRPVIMSSALAWPDLEKKGVGFALPDTDVKISELLERLRAMSKPLASPDLCRNYAMNFDTGNAAKEIDLFLQLVNEYAKK